MTVHRRDVLCGLGGLAATAALGDLGAQTSAKDAPPAGLASQTLAFPRTSDFSIAPGYTYLNAAYTHPIPKMSMDAARCRRRRADSPGLRRRCSPS